MGYDPTYSQRISELAGTRPRPGARHGTIRAVMDGCRCPRCQERLKKARKRGMRL